MNRVSIVKKIHLSLIGFGWIFLSYTTAYSQQIYWAKLYALPEEDQINCIAQDQWGDMYAGGLSYYKMTFPGPYPRAMIYKLNPDGDTLYSRWLGFYGEVNAITENQDGMIRIAALKRNPSQLHLLTMTPDGFIFKRDTIPNILYVTNSCMGKDSSWILGGYRMNDFNSNWTDFYVQRIHKDGTIEPFLSLNPNHPDCRANRVEQLPNGKYLVSGYVGSRIATYTLNEDLSNPQFEIWYQTPNLSFLYSGYVSRIDGQRYMIGGQGGPCIVGQYDSLLNKYWLRKDVGTQVPPQAMTDGSVIFGYTTSVGTNNTLYRVKSDSSEMWKIVIKDSLAAHGINGVMQVKTFSYLDDESAVAAGVMYNGSPNREDPIFIKISNVGTPVTSLTKPKKGTLTNETLAPWPNPTGGTLYLKQHFNQAEVHVHNMAGKEVGSYQMRFGQPIDISGYESGVYLYRAVIDGKAYSGKIIKQ